MNRWQDIASYLWGSRARFKLLFIFTILMLFTMLGSRELWTQEHRWAEIVTGMFYRHDFIHPYLGNTAYYDKPLLSYWLVVATSVLLKGLSAWSLRLPSAVAGVLALFSIYRIGSVLHDRRFGMLCGWMLLTTYYFVFWARVSSADMMNVAGIFFALSWYVSKRVQPSFVNYAVFYAILAVTSLCKGLVGAVLPILCVFIDLILQQSWRRHLNVRHFLALIPAAMIYLLPFMASQYLSGESYQDNGLYLVYRENILRYFQPFDHQDPIYTYLIFLPLYLLPWTLFFIPALYTLKSRWKAMSLNIKWLHWCLLTLFLFFTFSGSRRNYYVLPLMPLAIMVTADYLRCSVLENTHRLKHVVWMILGSFILNFTLLDAFPAWYYHQYGINRFVAELKAQASPLLPWEKWQIITLDAESKNNFYLGLPPGNANFHIKGDQRDQYQSVDKILTAFPVLKEKPKQTIFVTRKRYQPYLDQILSGYQLVEVPVLHLPIFTQNNDTIAYLPREI